MKKATWNRLLAWLLTAAMGFGTLASGMTAFAEDDVAAAALVETVMDGETVFVPEDSMEEIPESSSDEDDLLEMGLSDEEGEELVSPAFGGEEGDLSMGSLPDTEELEETNDAIDADDFQMSMGDAIDDLDSESTDAVDDTSMSGTGEEPVEEEGPESQEGDNGLTQTSQEDLDDMETSDPIEAEGSDSLEMGASEPQITVSSSAFTLYPGYSNRIMASYSGVSGSVYMSVSRLNQCTSVKWDSKWSSGNSIGLTINGLSKGINIHTITLRQKSTNKILASKVVTVTVSTLIATNQLSVSTDRPTLSAGQTVTVNVNCTNFTDTISVSYSNSGSQYSRGEWGNYARINGGVMYPLRITGLKAGTSVYTIRMYRYKTKEVLKTVTVTATVTSSPQLNVSTTALTINQGESKNLAASISGYSGRVTLSAIFDNNICNLSWGSWVQNTVPFTIKGVKSGTTHLTIKMLNSDTRALLASKTITITVKAVAPTLTANRTAITTTVGKTEDIQIRAGNLSVPAVLTVTKTGSSCTAAWGSASGYNLLRLTAVTDGTTKFTVYLRRRSDNAVLASVNISISVAYNAKVTASKTSLNLNQGQSERIVLSFSGVGSGDRVTFHIQSTNSGCFSTKWDQSWSGNSIGLTYTGKLGGYGSTAVYLIRTTDNKVLAMTTVTVSVKGTAVRISASPTSVSLGQNGTKDVAVTWQNAPSGAHLWRSLSNTGVVSTEWVTNGSSKSLRLKAIGSGSALIYVYLADSSGKTVYAKQSVSVTVTGTGVSDMCYNFINTESSFGYNSKSRIPLASYQVMFGKTNVAQQLYDKAGTWNGSCYGMATTAGLSYVGTESRPSEFRSGATKSMQLSVSDFSSAKNCNLQRYIEAMHVGQYSKLACSYDSTHMDKYKDLVNAVKNCGGKPVIVSMWSYDAGHSVLAYSVTTGSSYDKVNIYDPNKPNTAVHITMNKNSSGSYTSWSYGSYASWYKNGAITYNTYSEYVNVWKKRNTGEIRNVEWNILTSNTGSFEIYNVSDEKLAEVRDGAIVSKADDFDMTILRLKDAPVGSPTLVYFPTRFYRIKNTDESIDELSCTMINVDLAASVTTSVDEIEFAVEDTTRMNKVNLSASADDYYEISLTSTAEGDPADIQLNGMGKGDGVEICAMTQEGVLLSAGPDGVDSTLFMDGTVSGGYTITSKASAGGDINPEGNMDVVEGASQTYRVKPDEGYRIKDILVDGASIGVPDAKKSGMTYRFDNIDNDHTIEAVFESVQTAGDGTDSSKQEPEKQEKPEQKPGKQETPKQKAVLELNVLSLPLKVKQKTTVLKITKIADWDSVVSWRSSNSKVVKVKQNGALGCKLTAGKKKGKATVTVVLKSGLSQQIKVSVQKKEVKTKKVQGIPAKLDLKKGETLQLTPHLYPITSVQKIKFTSSKKSVVSVTKKGKIKARKAGTAVITVKSGSKKAKCRIKVK